jgi:hypothetical protein
MPGEASRRELVGASLGLAGAALAASALSPVVASAAEQPSDRDILAKVFRIETFIVYCYERVLHSGALGARARQLVAQLLGHEREHVAAVKRELEDRGAPVQIAWTARSADSELARHHVGAHLTDLGMEHKGLRLLVDVESVAEGAWFEALGKLGDPALSTLGASIMACEAQHWTVLSGLSHHGDVKITVPYAFVRGSSGY